MPKILVIEDDPAIVQLLKLHFVGLGHAVCVAEDGMAGPMIAAREKPDLVLLDYNMPAANGGKVLERLRGSTFTAATPVIFITASPVAEIMSSVPDDARVRFVQKPIDFPTLDKIVFGFIGGTGPAAPPPAAYPPPLPGAPLPPLSAPGSPPPPPADDGPLDIG